MLFFCVQGIFVPQKYFSVPLSHLQCEMYNLVLPTVHSALCVNNDETEYWGMCPVKCSMTDWGWWSGPDLSQEREGFYGIPLQSTQIINLNPVWNFISPLSYPLPTPPYSARVHGPQGLNCWAFPIGKCIEMIKERIYFGGRSVPPHSAVNRNYIAGDISMLAEYFLLPAKWT